VAFSILTAILGSESLGGVFYNRHPMPPGDFEDGFEIGGLAEEMYRNDGLAFVCNQSLNAIRIDVETTRARIREYGLCAHACNAPGGGKEGKRRTDDFIPGTDAQRHERHQDRIRAGRHPNAKTGPG
jgi:hypothetical protein